MNNFYKQPIVLQWFIAVVMMLIGFYPSFLIIELTSKHSVSGLLFILILPLLQFAFTPIYKLSGMYTYYSPMLLGYMANAVQIDLHSGGSFDYLMVMRNSKSGLILRNKLIMYYLEGLLNITNQIEQGTIPRSVNIKATSYFFNERTIKKMGFEVQNPSAYYRLNLLLNFIDLTWMYSLSMGKFSIPKIWDAKKMSIKGECLLEKKELLISLLQKMSKLKLD
jgi:hypothetical protein